MKRLLLILIIIISFQSLSNADDIREFEIEGMSLYESALNHFSKSFIKNNEEDYYKDNKYKTATISSNKFEIYQQVQITYKSNDQKFTLIDINGIVDKNYKDCLNEIKIIAKNFDDLTSLQIESSSESNSSFCFLGRNVNVHVSQQPSAQLDTPTRPRDAGIRK